MENRQIIIGLTFGLILIFAVSIWQINFLTNEIEHLRKHTSELESQIEERDDLIGSLETHIDKLDENLSIIQHELYLSNENNTILKSQLNDMNVTIIGLQNDVTVLEEAIYVIGRGEIETVLRKYSDTLIQLNQLQDQYDELLYEYNKLIENIE